MMTVQATTDPSSSIGGDAASLGTRAGAFADEAVTGPMPVIDLVDGHLHVSLRRGVVIAEVDGGLDDALAAVLAPAIRAAVEDADAAILDLDQVTLLDRTAVESICAALDVIGDPTSRCIVAGRLSGRLVLERWDVPNGYAIFSSVPDALQARAFVESGYGNGWTLGV